MESGPVSHSEDGLLGSNTRMKVNMNLVASWGCDTLSVGSLPKYVKDRVTLTNVWGLPSSTMILKRDMKPQKPLLGSIGPSGSRFKAAIRDTAWRTSMPTGS